MRNLKKLLALVLVCVLAFTAFATPAFAANSETKESYSVKEVIEHRFYQFVDRLIRVLGRILNAVIPGKDWAGKTPWLRNYQPENFYPGKATFDAAPKEGAAWSMGFSEASFLTNIDPMDGTYYMAGSLEALHGRVPAAVLDDQGVNTVAFSDGDVTVTYSSIDGFGLTRGDVLEIRRRLKTFAAEHDIVSINVSALHQHSCIDTLGLAAPLVPALFTNPFATMFKEDAVITGRNPQFMEEVYTAVTASVIAAVEDMTPGAVYYGSADVSDFIKDKRDPQAFDGEIRRLRFVPDDGGSEIWICETGIHPVSLGAGGDQLSADYPHYLEQYVREETGADLLFIQGAELAITVDTSAMNIPEEASDTERLAAIGAAIGDRVLGIDNETALEPLINVAHREVVIDVENPVHTIAGREGLLGSVFVRDGLGYSVITELGYMELGGELGVVLVPGEIDPAILWGGAVSENASWTNESWDYTPWAETCGAKELICFGLCNDQVGYILCDNDVRSMLTENEEINAVSTKSGSVLTGAFELLIADVK